MIILPFESVEKIGDVLTEKLETPFVFAVLCDLHNKPYCTSFIKAPPIWIASFIILLLQKMIDLEANDNEILKALQLVRKYVKNHGGNLRPVTNEDFKDEETG